MSRADGARRQVYERLADALAPRARSLPIQPALLAVAMPLFRILRRLPEFSKQTKQISRRAQTVRQALREARSPDELLFEQLPAACGMPPFHADEAADEARVDTFSGALRESLQELQNIYPHLIRRIESQIGLAFGLRKSGAAARAELQTRYELIAATTNDRQLRMLGVRLETADPDGEAWIESVAALLGRRPPEHWSDDDLPAFALAINDLGRRFRAAEEFGRQRQGHPGRRRHCCGSALAEWPRRAEPGGAAGRARPGGTRVAG
ncbi:MAG: hypothetical protein HC828_02920 [Blastochloris sp.]|nr:hypothetical protein [Blastochloris sp.]